MPTPLTNIRNIGPAFAEALKRAEIMTAEELQEIGADAAYKAMIRTGTRPHFIGYYVLHMALQGRPWNDCRGDEKKDLRKRFDALKAATFDLHLSEFENILNEIGVVNR